MPGYEVLSCLGAGGFATVWEARPLGRDGDAGRDAVAVKVGRVVTAHARERFAYEAAALARIGAPHVPALQGSGVLADGRPYLVMECLRGVPLSEHLGRLPGPPDIAWVRDVGDVMFGALEAVHARGVVHGDLSPDNVFLCAGDRAGDRALQARLMDIGAPGGALAPMAGQGDAGQGPSRVVVGTAEYMAPEQFAGHADVRADIYAAGVLLYEMLTLRVPFVGSRAAIEHGHVAQRPPRPGTVAQVPGPLEELCLACLAKDPAQRPPDVAALRRMLAQACAEAARDQSGPVTAPRRAALLGDARRPVVLLAVDVTGAGGPAHDVISAIVSRRKGTIARQHGRSYVCGWAGLNDDEPAQRAAAAACELAGRGMRVALHVASLKVRRGRGGRPPKLYGAAVEDPSGWMPPPGWQGILASAAFARVLPAEHTRPAPGCPGFHEVAGAAPDGGPGSMPGGMFARVPVLDTTRLVGRDDVLTRAGASLDAVLRSASPGLFTLYGKSGMGKSRIARHLEGLVRRVCPEARVLSLCTARRQPGQPNDTIGRLLDMLAMDAGAALPASDAPAPAGQRTGRDPWLLGDRLRSEASRSPLVVILDDAHRADGATLDALEYATLDGEGVRLWVAVAARPALQRRRPMWGQRAHRHDWVNIGPLAEDAAMKLAAELLRPAEYPPAATLRRLAQWAGCSPHALSELVRTLKREGIVRKRPHGESWYVATAELDRLPASPAEQWLAARRLDALLPELAACLRLCAVLGVELLRDELEWVQDQAARAGTASTTMTTEAGLDALEREGLITHLGGGVWAFPQSAFQDATYELVGEGDRLSIHGHALAFWRAQAGPRASGRVLAAIARHAGASSAWEEAADAYLTLGDRARAEHRDADADQHYTAALGLLGEDEHARRVRALGGRGKARYHMQRSPEALADLGAAKDHARALGDTRLLAELILEEATALDWAEKFAASARQVEVARPLVEGAGDARLRARYWKARGRCAFRAEHMSEAVTLLGQAAALAAEQGDDETHIVALLLLAPALVCMSRLDEAEARFEEVIALCERTGDRLHLCAAYSNRGYLWSARKSLSGIAQDLRCAVKLAREIGQPMAERVATHNLAEFLHWSGKHREALSLARRACALQRFLPAPVAPDLLLLARIHAALGELDAARHMLAQVRALDDAASHVRSGGIAMTMIELVVDAAQGRVDAAAWDRLLHEAEHHVPGEELLEVHYFRARAAASGGAWDEVARIACSVRALLDAHPVWQAAFDALARSVPRAASS